jgi:hypothetical protein
MKNEFQPLSMAMFQMNEVLDSRYIVGGATTDIVTPAGGANCDTEGGTKTLLQGTDDEYTLRTNQILRCMIRMANYLVKITSSSYFKNNN